jgi:16S rRNA (guanine527-N7)-methyltransferase
LRSYPAAIAAVLEQIFGDRLPLVERYAELLETDGVAYGLLGPSESARIWDRHILNCAFLSELIPVDVRVVDVGSGAGLPGLVIACCRSDLRVDLVESMQRRVDFLSGCVSTLGLADQVKVCRGRAESRDVVAAVGNTHWVTARAVAPLDRLAQFCLPLLARGGTLLAMKGQRAAEEVREHSDAITRLGGVVQEIALCGTGRSEHPTTVVVIRKR